MASHQYEPTGLQNAAAEILIAVVDESNICVKSYTTCRYKKFFLHRKTKFLHKKYKSIRFRTIY